MYKNIIGIDIGKDSFFAATHSQKNVNSYNNNPTGFKKFFADNKNILPTSLVIIENTGGYELALINYLYSKNIAIHCASGLQVKNFIRSFGKYAKTDKIDAIAIANYGYERQNILKLYQKTDKVSEMIKRLVMRRYDLVNLLVKEKNRYQSPNNSHTSLKLSVNRMINLIQKEITQVEEDIMNLINTSSIHQEKLKTLQEVKGIGVKSSIALLALIPELGTLNRKQVASLCGVAPHPKQSGSSVKYHNTVGGRRNIRPILYLCAMAASRSKSTIGEWYRNLIQKGKKPLVALVALMRKIIVIANAKLKDLNANLEISKIIEKHS